MFYSHEILTSRRYGVATVWLVATLGSSSGFKKINRKAILGVNIPKACETVQEPDAPMALRLQSNLLYGISRVYAQQCYYVLSDAEAAQMKMSALLKVIKTAELDPNAGRARPGQLILQDDPAFIPDAFTPDFDLDLAFFESSQGSSHPNSVLSNQNGASSQSSNDGDASVMGLIIPTSESGNVGGLTGARSTSRSITRDRHPLSLLDDGNGFDPNVAFGFDAEGNIRDVGNPAEFGNVEPKGAPRLPSDPLANARVIQEHGEGYLAGREDKLGAMNFNETLQTVDDEPAQLLLDAEPFPDIGAAPGPDQRQPSSAVRKTTSEYAEALQSSKPRTRRTIPVDKNQQIRNSELAKWNAEYLTSMASARDHNKQKKLKLQAKTIAQHWVYGSGINNVGNLAIPSHIQHPLSMFAGDSFYHMLTGTSRKRDHSPSGSEQESDRRKSQRRFGSPHLGRGDEENELPPLFDDSIELGREALPLLEDHSSQMPWNVTTSHHGSRHGSQRSSVLRAMAGGFSSSAPGTAARFGSHRASRLVSTSPLRGRGQHRDSSIELPRHYDGEVLAGPRVENDIWMAGADEDLGAGEDFELLGPAANVDTQTVGASQWLRNTLETESGNFLEFVTAGMMRMSPSGDVLDREWNETSPPGMRVVGDVYFQELLPESEHTHIVAAQGFMHLLALATRGLLKIEQKEEFGNIRMGVAHKEGV